jgi:hypothetical protein
MACFSGIQCAGDLQHPDVKHKGGVFAARMERQRHPG